MSDDPEVQGALLKRAEFKIEQLGELLAQTEKLKAQFVATMSHELRTPLNVVLGFASLLADEAFGALSQPQAEAADKVVEAAERLAYLINDLLDFSRMQAGLLELNIAPLAFAPVAQEVLAEFAPLARSKSLAIEEEIPESLPPVPADPDRLRQMLQHLLDNAIKFTPSGGTVGLRARAEDDALVVEVWDTGIGIPERALPHLFERFYQADSSNTRQYGGTGLGLAMVKELAERQGGYVEAETCEGEGSTFRFRLPLIQEEELVG